MSKKNNQPDLPEVFRSRRKELGKSQRDTAAAAGITEASYVRIETGATSPRWKTISAISDTLEIRWIAQPEKKR